MPSAAVIEIREVTKCFGSFTAVDGVSLDVAAGEFLTLLGPSGCGKTTLLRMLSGFETPTRGALRIDGEDVTHLAPYRRNVNQVFQSYALFPHLTVAENIAFGLRMQKVPAAEIERRVGEVIDLVALGGFSARRPHELSGGQRQRVALARAIVPRPKVLLLDEPLSAPMTFVFVTHDQEEALTMSDRIAVFNRGRVEQIGSPSDIYHHPRTTFVADFIGEANLLRAEALSRTPAAVRLRVEGGLEVEIPAERWPSDWTSGVVSLRPEKILVSKRPIGDAAGFTARVTDELFQGALDRLHLQTESGTRLFALVANESALREAIHAGDTVWCGVHSDDVAVVGPA